jgi:hypothetical protein
MDYIDRSFIMIVVKLKELTERELNEMSIQVVSSRKDGLPFRIAVKAPDHPPPHAHIMDLQTGRKEMGQFLISEEFPAKPEDIKDYKRGISDDMRRLIFQWAIAKNMEFPVAKNWELLWWEWSRNEKW